MSKGKKTVHVPRGYNGLHAEVAGCIVNITIDVTADSGGKVTHISVLPDTYAGEEWHLPGWGEQIATHGLGFRVIEGKID